MNYADVLAKAKETIGPNCKVCPVCNGLGCGNIMPGPGSKAPGNGANDNFNAWRKIKLNMDTIAANVEIDTPHIPILNTAVNKTSKIILETAIFSVKVIELLLSPTALKV